MPACALRSIFHEVDVGAKYRPSERSTPYRHGLPTGCTDLAAVEGETVHVPPLWRSVPDPDPRAGGMPPSAAARRIPPLGQFPIAGVVRARDLPDRASPACESRMACTCAARG